jgi:hypothetical protein
MKEEIKTEEVVNVPSQIAKETVDLFVEQRIKVSFMDQIPFMKALETLFKQGAEFKGDKFPSLRSPILEVELVKKCDVHNLEEDMMKSSPGIHASPVDPAQLCFSVEFVEALPWETFRKLCKAVGIGGRDRSKMTKQYLEFTENYL